MSWQAWLTRNGYHFDGEHYDSLIEFAISKHRLQGRGSNQERADQIHFLIDWWWRNRKRFTRYKMDSDVSSALKIHRTTVVHYVRNRKKTNHYDRNTALINQTINRHES